MVGSLLVLVKVNSNMAEPVEGLDKGDFEIPETKKKIYFVALDNRRKKLYQREEVEVTVAAKYGLLNIGQRSQIAMTMQNGWYKLFYDVDRQIIGWKVKHELNKEEMEDKGWKVIKPNSSGQLQLGVGRILDLFTGLDREKSYKGLRVKKYQEKDSLMDNSVYYYIQVSDDPVEVQRFGK